MEKKIWQTTVPACATASGSGKAAKLQARKFGSDCALISDSRCRQIVPQSPDNLCQVSCSLILWELQLCWQSGRLLRTGYIILLKQTWQMDFYQTSTVQPEQCLKTTKASITSKYLQSKILYLKNEHSSVKILSANSSIALSIDEGERQLGALIDFNSDLTQKWKPSKIRFLVGR